MNNQLVFGLQVGKKCSKQRGIRNWNFNKSIRKERCLMKAEKLDLLQRFYE